MIKQLRILSTVLFAFAVGQAGLGSGYLDKIKPLLVVHSINAFVVLALTVASVILGLLYRRSGGPGWTFFLPLTLIVMAAIQITLGFAEVLGGHVFWGVLFLCTVTAFCSYSWRLKPEDSRALS